MKKPPRQIRLDPDILEEVQKISEVTDLPQVEIIRQMVAAGVRVIRANGYKLTLPLRLKLDTEEAASSPATKEGTAESFLDKVSEDLRERAKGGSAHRKSRQ